MRKYLVFFLCGAMAAPPVSGNQYQDEFEALNRRMREKHAPAMVGVKLAQSLLLSNQYLAAMSARFESHTRGLNLQSQGLSVLVEEMKGYSSSPTLSNYKLFLQTSLRHRLLTSYAMANLYTAREVAAVFDGQADFFDNYCEPRMSLLSAPDTMPSLPMGVKEDGSVYTRNRHIFSGKESGSFSEDPVADGAAIATFGAALVVGLAIYAASAGISIAAAAISVLSVQSSGGALILCGTGAGAVIVLAAIAVAVVVSIAVTENENRKRKEEAEEKYQQEIDDFNNAKAWYLAQRMTAEEYRAVAKVECASEKWQKKISESRDALLANIASLRAPVTDLDVMEAQLKENEENVNQTADRFAEGLIAIYSAEYVESVRKAILPQAKLSAAADYANTYIKPQQDVLTAFYAENRKECFALQEQLFRSREELKAKQTLVEESYKEPGNAQEPFFTHQLPEMVSTLLTLFEKRVNRCFEQAQTSPGIGPIYDL